MNPLSRVSLSAVAIAGVLSAMLVGVAGPTQAVGIGTGRAVVHIDAPEATATKQADGSYELTLPAGSTGQWMGERTNAAGKTKVRVGNLTAQRLSTGWRNFQYTQAGATATLLWNAGTSEMTTAVVRVSQPRLTDAGVAFTLTTDAALPTNLTKMSLHLDRAPGKKVRNSASPSKQIVTITGGLSISIEAQATAATPRILGNNATCWQGLVNPNYPFVAVKTSTCANITYTDGSGIPYMTYGVNATFNKTSGSANFTLNITPPGQAMYPYSHTFQWSVTV